MGIQKKLFEDNINKETDNSGNFLNKSAVKNHVRKTRLQPSNDSFILEKWTAVDDGLPVNWKIADTALGKILVATTQKGICFVGFAGDNSDAVFADFQKRFPTNSFEEKEDEFQKEAINRINKSEQEPLVHLHLRGSEFQLRIWERLMRVPFGGLTTYLELGESAKNARATGTAVGTNPVSIIVACHRVVRADGSIEGYHWGTEIKRKLLAYEAANC
jgi:AraC family transcriptional regulator of adaptative response/methylated-DNA-[protein]-cysteine methyltransferase